MTKSSWSRVLTALGVVLLVSAAVSFLLFGGRTLALLKLALAAAGLGGGLALSGAGGLRRFFSGRALHFGFFTAVSAVLLVALLAVASWTAYQHPLTLDLTRDRVWSLSEETVQVLGGLDHDVEALAFYGPGDAEYRAVRALLEGCVARSPRFHVRLVDPQGAPELVRAYGLGAGQPRVVLAAEGRTERAEAPTEEALANALVRLTHPGSRRVYFTEGHGEAPLRGPAPDGLSTATGALEGQGYQVAAISIVREGEVPADAAALLVVAPRRPLLDAEVTAVRRFLGRGGRLAVFVEPQTSSGLEPLLAEYGMELDDDLVLDSSPEAQAMGGKAWNPVLQPASEHAITRSLAAAQLALVASTARSLSALTAAPVRARPVVLTSATAWGETEPSGLREGGPGAEQGEGEKGGPMPVAMAAERSQGTGRARVVAVGDADLVENGLIGALGNRDFFLNTVSWLAAQEDSITLRPRARAAAVVVLSEAQALTLATVTVDLVPVLLLALGLSIFLVRRSR